MAILSKDGGAANLPADLLKDSSTPVTNTDQFQVVIEGLDPNKTVPIQFAWVYPDKTVSDYSPTYDLNTSTDPIPNTPALSNADVEWANGYLKIVWNGKDTAGADLKNIKQVNIWIRGGTFGATSVKTAHFFTGAGTKTISLPSDTYYVKLQAETALGKLSAFSNEIQASLIQKPSTVSNLTATWKKSDGVTKSDALRVAFNFDTTLAQNKYVNTAVILLTGSNPSGQSPQPFTIPINKTGTLNEFYLSSINNKYYFNIFQNSFTVSVYVIDTFNVTGNAITITSETYSSPLDTPVITATAEVGGYSISYNSQTGKPFDQIYIYEDTGSGYIQVAQGTSNPIRIGTQNYIQRSVKALFYDTNSGYTAYSNIVTVTPISADTTDTTPPGVPTVTAGTVTFNTIGITVNNSDTTTKGHKVRYKKSTDTYYSTFDIAYSGTSTATTLFGLTPNSIYNIGAASYDQFNNLSAFSSNINASTSTQTVSTPTSVTLTGAAVGAIAAWTAPVSPSTPIDKYKVELYKTGTPDTIVTTEYTFSTTISFGGLSSGTYYVKVYTQDIYGVLSVAAQSSNATVTAGGSSDGLAPSSSPTPTINSIYGALEVKWSPVTNADTVTYEVHVSTVTGFTPSAATKSIEVDGTFAIIKTLPGTSTALTYGTTYYVKLIAKDKDGSASAGTQSSGTPLQVDNGDLAANSIRANVIQAGTITATQIDSSNLLVGKLFAVGSTTDSYAIKINATANTVKLYGGNGIYSDVNTAFYLDTTGKFSLKDRLYFDGNTTLTVNGVINASSGNFAGAMTVNNGTMKFGTSAGGSGNDGIYINTNSYWYSNGNFAIGAGSGNSSVIWNGTSLTVTGAINASSGTVTGNFQVSSGTITTGASATSGSRINVTSTGIFAYDASSTNNSTGVTTQIFGNASTGGTTFKTVQAELGNWMVDLTTIKNNGITLTAPNTQGALTPGKSSIIASRGGYYAGIQTPSSSASGSDILIWAGQSADGTGAAFRVTGIGDMYAGGITFDATNQKITFKQGFTIDNDVISVPTISVNSDSGSTTSGGVDEPIGSDTNASNTVSEGTPVTSTNTTTLSIMLPGATSTNSPKLTLSAAKIDGTGTSVLLENKSSGGTSSIQLSDGGLTINVSKIGGLLLKGFTNKTHYTYNGSVQPAALNIKPDGTITTGRAIFRSGASESKIIPASGTSSHANVGLVGDIILSTAD